METKNSKKNIVPLFDAAEVSISSVLKKFCTSNDHYMDILTNDPNDPLICKFAHFDV